MGEAVKQELSPAIDAYQNFRSSQDYSRGTLAQDKQVLKRFLSVTGNVWCHAVTDRHVQRYFEVAARTRGASTLKVDHGVLVRFFKWCRHTGRMGVETDPMYGRRQPKATQKERNRIPVEDFPRLLETAGKREPRDRALVALLLYTLMRDGEVTDLRIRDLDLNNSWLHARIHKTKLEDKMPVSAELDVELRAWLTHYTTVVGPLEPHYFLVPSRAVHPIRNGQGRITHHEGRYRPERQMRAAGRIVTPILEMFDFPVRDHNGKALHEGAHTIRRSGARALFDSLVSSGYDHALRVVQSMLHHSSMQMTERYLGITADRRSRDELIRGHRMYAQAAGNVVRLAK